MIRGKVDFAGSPPAQKPFRIAGDEVCEEFHQQDPILRQNVVVNPNDTLKDVVVWISEGGPDYYYKSNGGPLPTAVILQEKCRFYPRVVTLRTGQKLKIQNNDPTIHNINTFPKNNDRINIAMLPGGDPAEIVFDKPEIAVQLKSDIHPWMTAWVAVFDHQGYTVTGEDGTFEIVDLPPGEYTLNAWHEEFGTVRMPVLVQKEKPSNVVFSFTAHGSKAGTQLDMHGLATTGTVEQ